MEIVKSIFDLYNRKETGLSRTLASLIYSDYKIIKEILKKNDLNFSKEDRKTLEVSFEASFGKSRFDILCISKNFVIVIEIKLGLGIVSEQQAQKYINIIKNYNQANKILILLTQFGNQVTFKCDQIMIITEQWRNIYEIIKKHKITLNLSEEFDNYLTGSQLMKISDIDIWAVVISQESEVLKLENDLVYRNNNYHQPVFIGLREWDKTNKKVIIKKLFPVKEIIAPNTPRARIYNNEEDKAYIYVLEKPLILEKPIMKKFSQNSAIGVNFSDLNDASPTSTKVQVKRRLAQEEKT
jgi:hypothetical protein